MFTQLQGCDLETTSDAAMEMLEKEPTRLMFADAMGGLVTSTFHECMMTFAVACNIFIYLLGLSTFVAAMAFLILGPLTWSHNRLTWWFERRFAPMTMGWRHRFFIYPSLQISKWILRREIRYLHGRFKAARQQGGTMIDLESIYQDLCEYWWRKVSCKRTARAKRCSNGS